MLLENLISEISYVDISNYEDVPIDVSGVSYNSKRTQPGDLFICLTGDHVDGHEYAYEAINNGAVAIVAERQLNLDIPQVIVNDTSKLLAQIASKFYNNPSQKINVIGVTGTNGKTTVSHLIQKLYEGFSSKCALIGTLGHRFDSMETYRKVDHTTPQAPDLQRLIYFINEKSIDNLVMEVSSHSLVQNRVNYVDFNGAVFTNLTQDHLDFHITMENYFRAKAKLFSELVLGDFAVINMDDEYSERFLQVISPNVSVYKYGVQYGADVMAKDVTFSTIGASFTCVVKGVEYPVNLTMNGMFSVYNVMAALTTALAVGFDIEKSIKILEQIKGVDGRFEVVTTKPMVIVDYAHTPDGLENVLKAARRITPIGGKLICLFGCGGDRDATKRPKMGSIAEQHADKVIITSDNPRSENPQQIITDILAGFKSINEVVVEPDRGLAICEAYKIADENDVVLIAGKGHEDYQILATETIHFDDRAEVKKIFAGE